MIIDHPDNYHNDDQDYFKLHKPSPPRLKLPPGQKLLRTIKDIKAQAQDCKLKSILKVFSINIMALGALQSDSNEGEIGTTGQNKNKKEVVADQAEHEESVKENISQVTESIDAEYSLSAKENDVALDVETLKENDSETSADAAESETIEEKEKAERNIEDAEKITITDYQIDEVENTTSDQDITSSLLSLKSAERPTHDKDKCPPNDVENKERLIKEDFEVEQSKDEEGNENIEKQEKGDIKEDCLNTKEDQDNTKEDGFAVQALASFGFGLGLTVHGSALVFPAVAVPRLKQVNSCLNL